MLKSKIMYIVLFHIHLPRIGPSKPKQNFNMIKYAPNIGMLENPICIGKMENIPFPMTDSLFYF